MRPSSSWTSDLKIRRYTPQIGQIMNLLPGDVGRPISDIAMNIQLR
jgi:hypothetical protein